MRNKKGRSKPDLAQADHVLQDMPAEREEDGGLPSGSASKTKDSSQPDVSGFWGHFDRVARITASLGVAGAAVIGVLQYIASNQDVRSERSLAVVREWKTEGLPDQYTRVQTFVGQKLQTMGDQLSTLPDDALERALINLGGAWVMDLRSNGDPDDLERAIDQLTVFFAQMEICIQADLCEEEVLRVYFAKEVVTFWAYFEGYAQLRRGDNYAGYGTAVDRLVSRFESAE